MSATLRSIDARMWNAFDNMDAIDKKRTNWRMIPSIFFDIKFFRSIYYRFALSLTLSICRYLVQSISCCRSPASKYTICLFQVANSTSDVTSNKNTHKMKQLYGCEQNSCTEAFWQVLLRSISSIFTILLGFYLIQFDQVWKLFWRFSFSCKMFVCAARLSKPISLLINKNVYILCTPYT